MADRLNAEQSLNAEDSVTSLDGRFRLVLQSDGNLVLYRVGGAVLWAINPGVHAVTKAIMQGDGNFVVYGPEGPYWASNTAPNPGSFLIVQDDGNVVIYGPGGPLWSTGTTISLPMHAHKKNKIENGWWMETEVTVSNTARIDGETKLINYQALAGFKGGSVILLQDGAGNVVFRSPAFHTGVNAAGVNPKKEATIAVTVEFPPDLVQQVEGVAIAHRLMPDGNLWKQRCDEIIQIGKGVAEVVAQLQSA